MSYSLTAVVVLAAGRGTRMKSKTPKVLHTLCGKTMLGFAIDMAKELKPQNVITVIRHEKEQVESYLREYYDDVLIVEQDDIPGTGRAVECALNAIEADRGTIIVTCADVPMLEAETVSNLIAEHEKNGALVTVLTTDVENPYGYGRIVKENNVFNSIVEEKDACEAIKQITEINAGVYAFDLEFIKKEIADLSRCNSQNEVYLTDLVNKAYKANFRAFTYKIEDSMQTQGVNDRVQLSCLRKEKNKRICEYWMREGVTIFDPQTTWIDCSVVIENDVTILPNTILEGSTYIATDSVIGPDTNLKNVKVANASVVNRTFAIDSSIGSNANVGPYSYLRPGTHLKDKGKIGGFVETKNSTIGTGSKVPHLSYVGDAQIGEYTNIGAASVFVNYDGVTKHKTVVGDHCRLGSDNLYVAPLTIGDGVYTGAGTVIRKDLPSGSLSVNDMDQRIIEGWVEKKRPDTPAAIAAKKSRQNNINKGE